MFAERECISELERCCARQENLCIADLKATAEVLFEMVADGTVDLHAHDSHAAALPQQLFHLFAKISAFYAEGLIVHLNIRIAGNAEHGLFKYIVHFEHMVSVGEQNILGENIARRCLRQEHNRRQRCGHGQQTEPFGLFVAEQRGNMQHLALKVWERMVRVHNLRRENRRNDILEIPLDVFLFVRRKRIHCQSAQTDRTQFAVHIGERRVTTCIERLNRLVDQMQLLFGGQTGFAVGMLLVHGGHVAQAADADHEELIQITGKDCEEFEALEQRHVLILRLGEHAGVELQPRKLTVLGVALLPNLLCHIISPFVLAYAVIL